MFTLLLQSIALVNHAASFDVFLHPFAMKFELTQQALLVVAMSTVELRQVSSNLFFLLLIGMTSMTYCFV
jgi:hypothetical protein